MNILSPEYGQELISKYDKSCIVRDYSKITHCKDKYPIWGIMVLGYMEKYDDMNIRICYLPSNIVIFEIEIGQEVILQSKWKHEDITEATYEYFDYIISRIIKDKEDLWNLMTHFNPKSDWVKIEKKISNIFY